MRLHGDSTGRPVFCWPGLGGYPMNLRRLGSELDLDRPFYGIQANGPNDGETPYRTIREMAAADVAEIRRVQPEGPYTLWGYSFGARVAFEAAWQLEQAGQQVDSVLLLCPGNPRVRTENGQHGRRASYDTPAYVAILFSVFAGTVAGPQLADCLRTVHDEQSFVSFLERHSGFSATPPRVVELAGYHYAVLKDEGVAELAAAVRTGLDGPATPIRTEREYA